MTDSDNLDAHALHAVARQMHFPEMAGKVVFITGAGSGIGRSMADAFAANGARLALLDIDGAALVRAKAALESAYPGLEVDNHVASITDDIAVESAVAQGSGVILNTASMYGVVAAPERAAYCASKAAVVMLTKVMANEWAPEGLRVNALAPGYIQTALVDELVQAGRMNLDALTRRTPARRLGQPHEIATLALFLASDAASFINGQAIVADGGWSSYSYL